MAYLMIPIMLIGIPLGTFIKNKKLHKNIINKANQQKDEFHDLVDEKM